MSLHSDQQPLIILDRDGVINQDSDEFVKTQMNGYR